MKKKGNNLYEATKKESVDYTWFNNVPGFEFSLILMLFILGFIVKRRLGDT